VQGYLLWEAPEGAFSILIRRSVLERLKLFAEQAFSGGYSETGGVLLGRSEDLIEAGRRVISIENFESGVSPLHDDSVGFVRFRRQRALHLNEVDFLALRAGLGLVSMMIRPDGNGGAVGGFFYREGKIVRCPPAWMEFPIDGGAGDCHGFVRATLEDTDAGRPTTRTERLLYATVGLVLMICSVAIWSMGR